MKTYPYQTPNGIIELVEKREYDKLHAANAELIERLRERTESHLAASARDVQTIQRQSVLLERMANDLRGLANMPEYDQDDAHRLRHIASKALAAYESSNLKLVNSIDEAVKRMEEVSWRELEKLWDEAPIGESGEETLANEYNAVRTRLIQAAKSTLG